MPETHDAPVEISAFNWVPEPARGLVKALRVRWALEEIGQPYRVRYMPAFGEKPDGYLKEQPFGQVPTYRDDVVQLFETGAILAYLGERHEVLLPRDTVGKARAIGWVFAGLSSVEYFVQIHALITGFYAQEEWAKLRRAGAEEMARLRLQQLSDWLGDREWLEDRFTIGDLMMVTVLRIGVSSGIADAFPNLKAYRERGEARPAFQAALAAQMAGYTAEAPQPVSA